MNGENKIMEERMISSFDGTNLRFRKDEVENPKALIVIAHGLCEHLNRYDYFTEKLNENGYSVYRYDQRGHGKSEGKKVYFKDFNEMPDDLGQILALAREESGGKKVFSLWTQHGRRDSNTIWRKESGNGRWNYYLWCADAL